MTNDNHGQANWMVYKPISMCTAQAQADSDVATGRLQIKVYCHTADHWFYMVGVVTILYIQ